MRTALLSAFELAVRASNPRERVADVLATPSVRSLLDGKSITMLSVGKACDAMAKGAANLPITASLIISHVPGDSKMLAAHPVPDQRSVAAGRTALELVRQVPGDGVLLALISGGASSLMCLPRDGSSLAEKLAIVEPLRRSGAPIGVVNAARISLSAIKGGKLSRACRGRVLTLAVSDIIGDDLSMIGSGPTIAPERKLDRSILVASMNSVRDAAITALRGAGYSVQKGKTFSGAVDVVAETLIAAATACHDDVLVAAGEATVALPPDPGQGGRAQHLALLLARAFRGRSDRAALVVGTDGADGPQSDAPAGAFVDGSSWARIVATGIDPDVALERFNGTPALAAIGALVCTGPTGINHADLVFIARS